jgi:hydrogenase maturation protease
MNLEHVEKIANAVLYEGYLLYPYRPSSVKNRQRFNFGVLHPEAFDVSRMRTECVVAGASPKVDVKLRCLQLAERDNWQEGHERDVTITGFALEPARTEVRPFRFASDDSGGLKPGARMENIEGEIELICSRLADGVFKIAVEVRNCVTAGNQALTRDQALLRSMISAHTILQVAGGEFVSLLDPPEVMRQAVAECENLGTWPVLVGDVRHRDTMLSSPIILYDYAETAPESPGDLFDGTEIDEILALRILTMTDDEKSEVRNSDDRARRILERTEMLPPEHFQKLHGALRGMK